MISESLFDNLKRNYGFEVSWAVWDSNVVSNLSVIMPSELNASCILIGLNPSRETDVEWGGFHVSKNDEKLRDALVGTQCWGALITDLFPNKVFTSSSELKDNLSESDKDAAN